MDTAVVILNWNGEQWLRAFLPTVLERSRGHARVIVADNGSDDGSITWLRTAMPEVELVALGRNLGFAGGYNAALRQVDAAYFVLLNSDVEVTGNWIPALKDPLLRASYLCERRGVAIDAERNTAMPREFLQQQMAWREASSTATATPSAGGASSRSPRRTAASTTTNARSSGPPGRA